MARLLGGKRGPWAALTALALLVLAAVVGLWLAGRARQVPQDLLNSSLVARLFPTQQRGAVAELLEDPERSGLLVEYVDAMGQALEQLEAPGQWTLPRFLALLEAASQAGARLEGFSWEPEERALVVGCQGGDAGAMREAVEASDLFAWVKLSKDSHGDGQTYTIHCGFPGPDL